MDFLGVMWVFGGNLTRYKFDIATILKFQKPVIYSIYQ